MLYWKELPQEAIGAFDDFDWGKHSDELEHIIDFLTHDMRIDDLLVFLEGNIKEWSDGYRISLQLAIQLLHMVGKKLLEAFRAWKPNWSMDRSLWSTLFRNWPSFCEKDESTA